MISEQELRRLVSDLKRYLTEAIVSIVGKYTHAAITYSVPIAPTEYVEGRIRFRTGESIGLMWKGQRLMAEIELTVMSHGFAVWAVNGQKLPVGKPHHGPGAGDVGAMNPKVMLPVYAGLPFFAAKQICQSIGVSKSILGYWLEAERND